MSSVLKVFYFEGFDSFKKSVKKKESLLLKVLFSNQTYGFTALQTWEHLGDLSLSVELHLLKKGYFTEMVENAFRLSSYYRSHLWENLFTQSDILNHYMITDLVDFLKWVKNFYKRDDPEALVLFLNFLKKNQFKRLKIKIQKRNLNQQTDILKKLVSSFSFFSPSFFLIRLDLNKGLSFLSFKNWITKNTWIIKHLDFIEDPFFFHVKKWKKLSEEFSLPLAFDRALNDFSFIQKRFHLKKDFKKCLAEYREKKVLEDPFLHLEGFKVLVVKPTVQSVDQIFRKWQKLSFQEKKSLYFVFTHNRDHWLGKLYSLLEAKRFRVLLGDSFKEQFLDFGLLSENLYKQTQKSDIEVNLKDRGGRSDGESGMTADGREWIFKGRKNYGALMDLNVNHKKKVEDYLENLSWKLLVDFS